MSHPCLSCGACCAHYRVAFHWSETEPAPAPHVPAELTAPVDPHRIAMRGTLAAPVRCVALAGAVGRDAHCTVYARRPSPCRALQPAWAHGAPSPQCDRARLAYGLAPLTPEDWAHAAVDA